MKIIISYQSLQISFEDCLSLLSISFISTTTRYLKFGYFLKTPHFERYASFMSFPNLLGFNSSQENL